LDKRLDRALTKAIKGDPHLARVIEAWPALPEHIRAAVLALVNTAAPASKEQN
jgi:hypothetical protein